MNTRFVVTVCSAAVIGFALTFSAPASAQDAKACGKQWSALSKAEKKGHKKKDYVADCVAKAGPAATQSRTAAPKTAPAAGVKGKAGRQAMVERERACGKEWREAKAAGKIQKGQTWPKYWSACNTRMKQRGM
jgi:hypothetical protein